jgi:hypothetical protein
LGDHRLSDASKRVPRAATPGSAPQRPSVPGAKPAPRPTPAAPPSRRAPVAAVSNRAPAAASRAPTSPAASSRAQTTPAVFNRAPAAAPRVAPVAPPNIIPPAPRPVINQAPPIDNDMDLLAEDTLESSENALAPSRQNKSDTRRLGPKPSSRALPSAKPAQRLANTAASGKAPPAAKATEARISPVAKSTKRLAAPSSRRDTDRQMEEDGEADVSASRRTTKRSIRAEAPAGGIKPLHKLLAGVVLVLALVALLGWSPYWKSQHLGKLDSANTSIEDKKSAVKALYNDYAAAAYDLFRQRLAAPDAGTREASIYGIELFGKARLNGTQPFEHFAEEIVKADAPGKLLFIKSTQEMLKALDGGSNATPEKAKADEAKNKLAAAMFIAASDAKEPSGDVRLAAVQAVGDLRVPGVCKQLLSIATAEKGALREKAKAGVARTALPDAAPDLLNILTGTDEDLKTLAQDVFKNVQKGAKSAELLPHVSHKSPEVREKIVDALGERKNDAKAAEAMSIALKDSEAKIQLMAVKFIPVTGLSGPASQLTPLLTHADETMRVAAANTLGVLQTLECKKIILESFQNNPAGETLTAISAALAQCSRGKDLEAVAIIMPLLKKVAAPEGQAALRQVLTRLTLNKPVRASWDNAMWEKWHENILKREALKKVAQDSLDKARQGREIKNSDNFPALMKQVDKALEQLTECQNMCQPFDDKEDSPEYDRLLKEATEMRYHFQKFQHL